MNSNGNDECPKPDELRKLAAGEVSEDRERVLAAHLNTCSQCQNFVEAHPSDFLLALPRYLGQVDQAPTLPTQRQNLSQRPKETQTEPETWDSQLLEAPTAVTPIRGFVAKTQCPDLLPWLEPSASGLGKVDNFVLQEFLGRGGMGIVFKAKDIAIQRLVAIKFLSPVLASEPESRERFLREARTAGALSDPHVVILHGVQETNRLPYLVMEYIPGKPLDRVLREQGQLSLGTIVSIGQQIAAGLRAAHSQGIVHRDIKPANIIVREDGVVKLTDFGLSAVLGEARITQSNTILGTPAFMAPEMIQNSTLDHRSDLFSLGSVLYSLCTGRMPFHGESVHLTFHHICDSDPHPIREYNPEIPEWLIELIAALHIKDPTQRIQSALEVEVAFQSRQYSSMTLQLSSSAVKTSNNTRSHPETTSSHNSRLGKWKPWGLILALLIPMLFMGWYFVSSDWNKPSIDSEISKPTSRLVILRRNSKEVGRYTSLNEALHNVKSNTVVELHGTGPYELSPIILHELSLTLVGNAKDRSVILFRTDQIYDSDNEPNALLLTDSRLQLRNIELRAQTNKVDPNKDDHPNTYLIRCVDHGRLFVNNCRFIAHPVGTCLSFDDESEGLVEESELHAGKGPCIEWLSGEAKSLTLKNNLMTGKTVFHFPDLVFPRLFLTRNTIFAKHLAILSIPEEDDSYGQYQIMAKGNVFDTDAALIKLDGDDTADLEFEWDGVANVYTNPLFVEQNSPDIPEDQVRTLEQWKDIEGVHELESVQTRVQYLLDRADLVRKRRSPSELSLSQFKLRKSDTPLPKFPG